MPFPSSTPALTSLFALLFALGCTSGATSDAVPGAAGGGSAGASSTTGSAGGPGTATPVDMDQEKQNPDLFEVATRFFPTLGGADAKKRVARLTRTQLDNTTRTLLPEHVSASALNSLPADPMQTNYEYADNLSVNPANFTPYAGWVQGIVASVRKRPTTVVDCSAQGNSPACLREQAASFVRRAFRGIVSDTQITRFSDFYASSASQIGIADATADLVDLTLTSPNYLFRDEVLSDGTGLLRAAQRLQAIGYTLADSPPEALGFSSLAPDAAVATPADLQRTIDAALGSAAGRAKLMQFFVNWLEVREPADFGISTDVFPEFTADVANAVVQETKGFLQRQLGTADPRLRDLTESNRSTVSDPMAFIYGLPRGAGTVDLDPAQRLGVFTLPAVLASHSGPTTTRLVKRGVFFTRKVMCLSLGNPPAGLDTTIPVNETGTERQRIESGTSRPPCSGCHAMINPFGFMLESYDAIGRYRTSENGQPIDSNITVEFVDGTPFQAGSAVLALTNFTRSKQFQQCFARQLFRFYLGRDETPGDDPVLRQMFFDFANQDQQSILGMLRTLAGSSALSRRAEAAR